MNAASAAYVTARVNGEPCAWHFTGVTAIEHSLSLTLNSTAAQGMDLINGARNQPDRVTLTVIETDTEHSPGWAARMLAAMAGLKRKRMLCGVVTSMGSYTDMLLTEITATQDEENQCGWSGSLTFTQYVPSEGENAVKTNDNSSTRENTGFTGTVKRVTESAFLQMLQRAGINVNE